MADEASVFPLASAASPLSEKKTRRHHKKKLTQEELSALISLVVSAATDAYRFLSLNDLLLHPSQALTLESSIKSAAISVSKLHSLVIPANDPPRTLTPPPLLASSSSPSPSWFRRFLSGPRADSDVLWFQFFRVTRSTFTRLLQALSPHLGPTPDYSLAAALFRLAHAAPYKGVARRFGFDSSASACRGFHRVVKAIVEHLFHLFHPSPTTIEAFNSLSLPNCCGMLGFHRFFTTEGSLIVQGLVDSDGRFLDVSAGWPGTVSPDSILPKSRLFARIEYDKELLNGPPLELPNGDAVRQYIVGDSCCHLFPWLITPFEEESGQEGDPKEVFNSVHRNGMRIVEKAFARVLAQWRLLSVQWKQECLEPFAFLIVAGCLLHNFLISSENPPPAEIADFLQEQRFPVFRGQPSEEGERLRNVLRRHLTAGHRNA